MKVVYNESGFMYLIWTSAASDPDQVRETGPLSTNFQPLLIKIT